MKKKTLSVLLVMMMLFGVSLTAFAASPDVKFESSYDADTGLVSVSLYVTNPIGLESADLKVAYDPEVYSYVDYTDDTLGGVTVAAGKSVMEEGLCTCSLIFMKSCDKEDLDDDGNLPLVTYQFKPLKEDYAIDDFCSWATSFQLSGSNLVNDIKPQGNENLKVGHTYVVTVKNDSSANKTSGSGGKWYVYVIAGVLAVGAIVGIAVIAVKNGQKTEDEEASAEKPETKTESKPEAKPEKKPEPTDSDSDVTKVIEQEDTPAEPETNTDDASAEDHPEA